MVPGSGELKRPPTMNDARAAATAVAERVPGVVKIGLFGSVARGNPRPHSDIDLLVVVKDLDYRVDRPRLAGEVRSAARRVTPFPVGVVLTDVTEWARRSSLRTTMEREISRGLLTLYDNGGERRLSVAWEKAMEKASTDLGEAYVRLGEAAAAYRGALRWLSPSAAENKARRSRDRLHAVYLTDRHRSLLTDLDMVLETSLKAMHHASGESAPDRTHKLSVLANGLPPTPERSRALKILNPLRVKSLPPAPPDVDAYLAAADQITVLTLEVLAERSEGGVLEGRREVVMHRAAFTAMRKAWSRYDAATGRRRRVGRFKSRSSELPLGARRPGPGDGGGAAARRVPPGLGRYNFNLVVLEGVCKWLVLGSTMSVYPASGA